MGEDLRYERNINAPPEIVFDAFTSPGGQEAFYGQDDPGWIVESVCDLRVGGIWAVSFGPTPTQLYRHRHVFEAIEPPLRILMASKEYRIDGSTIDFTTEFTFADRDGRTLMTMVQFGFPTDELRDEHGSGVVNAFNRLERFTGTMGVS